MTRFLRMVFSWTLLLKSAFKIHPQMYFKVEMNGRQAFKCGVFLDLAEVPRELLSSKSYAV